MKCDEGLKRLQERRSVRSFEERQITEEELQAIIQVLKDGPSAHNKQLYHFTVVQDKALLDEMAETIRQMMLNGTPEQAAKASKPGYSPLHHAPTVIFIAGELSASFHIHTDCGIATGLAAAAAEELGLASCITNSSLFMFKGEEGAALKKRLEIPEGYQMVCAVAVGYRKGEQPAKPPKKQDLTSYIR